MMRIWMMIAALSIISCAPAPVYRNLAIPIGSVALFDIQKFAGSWHFVADFADACQNKHVSYRLLAADRLKVESYCRSRQDTVLTTGTAVYKGRGRLEQQMEDESKTSELWVLWVDESYRTAVMGTPSGRHGWILDRTPEIPADRLEAAKAVLKFNGYDTNELVSMWGKTTND